MPIVLLLLVSLTLILTSCGGTASPAPTATPAPKPASVPPAASPSGAAPPPSSPAASPAVPGGAPSPASSPAASQSAPQGVGVRITIAQGSSEARFRVREQLATLPLPNEAVGRTRDVTGTIALNESGAVVASESAVQVDLRTLTSDQRSRDNFIQRSTLQTSQFPTADFVVKEAAGLPWPLPVSGSATFQLLGDLTVHGVTRPTTWQVTADLSPGEIAAQATAEMEISDFGMEPPRAGPVLTIEDDIRLELDVRATRA